MHEMLTEDLESLLVMFQDRGLIDEVQSELLSQVFIQSLSYYQTGGPMEERLKRYVQGLTELSWLYIEYGNSGIPEALASDMQRWASTLVSPILSVPDLGISFLRQDFRSEILVHIGLLNWLSDTTLAAVRTFALFPQTLCRVLYASETAAKETGERLANTLSAIAGRSQALASAFVDQVHCLAGRMGRLLLTDLHAGGPISFPNIYELGPTMYRDEADTIFVFSRTPGIVIPGEYYGDQPDSNRRIYFDGGILGPSGRHLKKYYQWNRATTAIALYRAYDENCAKATGEQYKLEATKVLAKFFGDPNLEISEGEFGRRSKELENFKLTVTLANRSSVVRTSRDCVTSSISRATAFGGMESDKYLADHLSRITGLRVDPSWSFHESSQPSDDLLPHSIPVAFKKLVDEEAVMMVKTMGQVLDQKAASETVDRLISLGRYISLHGQEQLVGGRI